MNLGAAAFQPLTRLAARTPLFRFMESLDAFFGAHWDHEPTSTRSADFQSAVSRISNPQALQGSDDVPTGSRRYGRLETCATRRRFMGSLDESETAREDHESGVRTFLSARGLGSGQADKNVRAPNCRFMESVHGFLPRMVPMNRMGDRNAAFRLQRVEVPMVLQPEGRVPESRLTGRFIPDGENIRASLRRLLRLGGRSHSARKPGDWSLEPAAIGARTAMSASRRAGRWIDADMAVRAPRPRFTGRGRLCGGFSVTELLVAVSLMGIIVFALYSTFNQTQRALRANVTQVDVMESGRAAMEMITRELEQVTASAPTTNINLFASLGLTRATAPKRISPVVQGETNPRLRTNVLQQFFFLNHVNNQWVGTGYHVEDTNGLGVGPLERFAATVHESAFRTNDLYTAFLTNALSTDEISRRTFHHLADGIIHLRLLAYDTNGMPMTFAYNGTINHTNSGPVGQRVSRHWIAVPSNAPPNAIFAEESFNKARETQFVFLSNALPAYLELELGVLEPDALKQFNALRQAPAPAASDFLRKQANRVHLFRKRIPIRSAPQ